MPSTMKKFRINEEIFQSERAQYAQFAADYLEAGAEVR